MKKKAFYEIGQDTREFFRILPEIVRTAKIAIPLFALLLVLLAILLRPLDVPFNHRMVEIQTESLAKLGDRFRHWGDFRDTVTVTLLLLVGGWLFKRRHWRRMGVAFFLSVCLAGLSVNVLKLMTGRPRPHMQYRQVAEDRFYGPIFLKPRSERPGQAKFRSFKSFPSGHSGTSAGAAAMLLVAAPVLGIPMALSAAGIIWASVYGSSHYITDVVVGAGIGLLIGSLGGLTCRRMRSSAASADSPGQ